MTDYRALLLKYMAHVNGEEGITFLDSANETWGGSGITFTEEEVQMLEQIERELPPR